MRRLIAVVDMEAFHWGCSEWNYFRRTFHVAVGVQPKSLKLPAVEPVITLKKKKKKDTGEEIIDCGRGGDVCCRCGREGSC